MGSGCPCGPLRTPADSEHRTLRRASAAGTDVGSDRHRYGTGLLAPGGALPFALRWLDS